MQSCDVLCYTLKNIFTSVLRVRGADLLLPGQLNSSAPEFCASSGAFGIIGLRLLNRGNRMPICTQMQRIHPKDWCFTLLFLGLFSNIWKAFKISMHIVARQILTRYTDKCTGVALESYIRICFIGNICAIKLAADIFKIFTIKLGATKIRRIAITRE